mgnify:FL=1
MKQNNVTKTVAERVAELLNKAYSEPKLLFHTGGTKMFLEDGKLPEESEESLEQVITRYVEGRDAFRKLRCKMHEASQPYLRQKMENGKLVRYIDYDEWERQDSEECLWLAIAEQNSFHALDIIERSVDLKIAQLYAKKGVEIPPEPETDPILKKKYLIKKTQ